MKRVLLIFVAMAVIAILPATLGSAATGSACKIPKGGDADNNGIGDADVQVICNYDSVYAYDDAGDYYWDLGDGRVYTSPGISNIEDLDQTTLSVCDYRIHTKGDFGNDPYMNSGDISNMIRCHGYDGVATYHYQIVSNDDPRFRGDPAYAIWGTWEYHVLTESGTGNYIPKGILP
ncbi:MAG: hypothetical protein M5U18_16480 [Dehalococcoidia bacterium]|nr:hypothetical protein [Dehalococcoidia bacterium]